MTPVDWTARPVALVSGGASGIGAATVRALAARGARVAFLDVDRDRGAALARETESCFLPVDVREAENWRRALDEVRDRLGPVALAHLNAGVMTLPPTAEPLAAATLTDLDDEAYRRVVGVNVDGVFFGLRALARAMAGAGGRIVVTASTGALAAVPFDPLYAMTKHAVIGLVRSAAPWLASRSISLSAICPGGVDTPLTPGFVRSLDPPLLDPAEVAVAVIGLFESAPAGSLWVVRPGDDGPAPVPEPAIGLS